MNFQVHSNIAYGAKGLLYFTYSQVVHEQGFGSALLATCVLPIFAGAALDSLWGLYSNPFAILGVGAMFLMIGAGVYELTAANGEKKPIKDLLKE